MTAEMQNEVPTILTEDGNLYILTGEFPERPCGFYSAQNMVTIEFSSSPEQIFAIGPKTAPVLQQIEIIHISETGQNGPVNITPVKRMNMMGEAQ